MSFQPGSYIRIWNFKERDSHKSGTISISSSKKDKQTGEYVQDFRHSYVTVCGSAFNQMQGVTIPAKGINARISNCEVTGNGWDKEKQEPKPYMFTIFGLAFEGDEGYFNQRKDKAAEPKKTNSAPKSVEVFKDPDAENLPF